MLISKLAWIAFLSTMAMGETGVKEKAGYKKIKEPKGAGKDGKKDSNGSKSGKKGSKPETNWKEGDLFLGVGGGAYRVLDREGNLTEILFNGNGGSDTDQCAFTDDGSELFGLSWNIDNVFVFNGNVPHDIIRQFPVGDRPEGILFDTYGNFYVGFQGTTDIRKYNAAGSLIDSFEVGSSNDHIDLSIDQKTMFYADQGRTIYRYDLENKTALPNFATLPFVPGVSTELARFRLLPPGDGSGGLLVASFSDIKRLDGGGNVIQTYDVPNASTPRRWYSLALDPNGCSFWSGDRNNGELYRFVIDSGEIEAGPFDAESSDFFGLCQLGERTAARSGKKFKAGKKCAAGGKKAGKKEGEGGEGKNSGKGLVKGSKKGHADEGIQSQVTDSTPVSKNVVVEMVENDKNGK